jgi:hypothetical protein
MMLVALLMTSVAGVASPVHDGSEDLATLVEWMAGSFSSAEQAADDPAYFDIRLQMVRIWEERDDGYWLYVEQATASSVDAPYRQRVYHLTIVEHDLFKSAVYALPDPETHAGQWREEHPLADLGPDDLELRAGCGVFLRLDGFGRFAGGTIGRGCGSALRGARYATSFVTVGPDGIESWDQGFDADGQQVWGAQQGPYVFLRADS